MVPPIQRARCDLKIHHTITPIKSAWFSQNFAGRNIYITVIYVRNLGRFELRLLVPPIQRVRLTYKNHHTITPYWIALFGLNTVGYNIFTMATFERNIEEIGPWRLVPPIQRVQWDLKIHHTITPYSKIWLARNFAQRNIYTFVNIMRDLRAIGSHLLAPPIQTVQWATKFYSIFRKYLKFILYMAIYNKKLINQI